MDDKTKLRLKRQMEQQAVSLTAIKNPDELMISILASTNVMLQMADSLDVSVQPEAMEDVSAYCTRISQILNGFLSRNSDAIQQQLSESRVEAEESLAKTLAKIKSDNEAMRQRREDLKEAEKKLKETDRALADVRRQADEKKADIEKNEMGKKQLLEKIETLTTRINKLEEEKEEFLKKEETLTTRLEGIEADQKELEAELEVYNKVINTLVEDGFLEQDSQNDDIILPIQNEGRELMERYNTLISAVMMDVRILREKINDRIEPGNGA